METISQSTLPEIQTLLKEFADVFAKSTKLPPSRVYDHTITLLPNVVHVNSRTYRYSPLRKTEIERQVPVLLLHQCSYHKRKMRVNIFV
jgi:hypothetical protein